ncbi:MAG: hypothetical protein IJ715_05715 [Bacilli bacterium]|nr:hypothetical protein [Bacilli bacterium]
MENIPLTKREEAYLKMIKPQHGVLYLKSAPGRAKSAILATLAKKLGWQYIDLRLAQLDPIAVGMFPSTEMVKYGDSTIKVMDFVTPKWALDANTKPTLINFDELNRAPEDVLKAAMQIFNERAIGTQFKFNNNVYMAATGNLGSEDATDVNDLDSALNGRLIHVTHNLKYTEWIDWGKGIIHPTILQYHEYNKGSKLFESFEKDKNNNAQVLNKEAYASPRTWHFLSEYIQTNYGKDADIRLWLKDISNVAKYYIGQQNAIDFIKFCQLISELTLDDVKQMSPRTEAKLTQYRNNKSQYVFMNIINQLENIKDENEFSSITQAEAQNINKFFTYCTKEQVAAALQEIKSNFSPLKDKTGIINNINIIFKGHADILNKLTEYAIKQ